jgi:MFS family permease
VSQRTYREVFAVAEFRALWLAQLLSVTGDQLARVALTFLAYERTRSPVFAAVAFAASYAPAFFGGLLLSGLADRLPRRGLMIACDLIRAGLVIVMAAPGVPLPVMIGLLFCVTMIGTPFSAARAAVYPEVLDGESYVVGTAVTLTTFQLAGVLGFAAGGAVVGLAGPRPALLADAATFAVSALLLRLGVRPRAAARQHGSRAGGAAGLRAGIRLVLSDGALRTPMLYGWLAWFYNAPEGIAAPFARQLHAGAIGTGLLLAAAAAGYTAGAAAFGRLVPPRLRQRLTGPLAAGCCLILILAAVRPGLPLALIILAASGVCSCFQVAANSAFVLAAPPAHRSQAFGLARGGMSLGQGTAMVLAGVAAQRFAPAIVIAASGLAGAVAATAITVTRPRARQGAHERSRARAGPPSRSLAD